MAELKYYKGRFSDAIIRHHQDKRLLILNVNNSINKTESSDIQNILLESLDFSNIKYIAVQVDLDTVGAKLKIFTDKFPDVEKNCVIFIGFDAAGDSKSYDPIHDVNDLAAVVQPIIDDYQAFYQKYLEEHPDFTSNDDGLDIDAAEDDKSFEDKKAELKIAIAKKREEKKLQEEQEERLKEIKRREEGKNASETQQKIRDEAIKREAEARRQQKLADIQYQQRLREEIERDKAERRARNAARNAPTAPSTSNTVTSAPDTAAPATDVPPQSVKPETRICYQFPNGVRVVKEFKSTQTFRDVYDAIRDDPNCTGNFSLCSIHPPKVIEEWDKNLIELNLAPATTVRVVTKNGAERQVVSQSFGYVTNAAMMVITLICGPLASLFQFFSLLFGFRVENPNEPSESEQRVQRQTAKRRRGGDGRNFKKDGNVQGLGEEDSTDDEGTWNGNSTQQL